MASLKAGRGAARILTKRAVKAAPRLTVLDPTLAKPRPVLPMEIRYDKEQEVPILCRTSRPYIVKHAMDEPGLMHSDLNKYWVAEVLQELYTEAAGGAGELGEQTDATLQAFQKFGSLLIYPLGTCCVKDKEGKLSVVVDDKFSEAVLNRLWSDPESKSRPLAGHKSTGYTMWAVSKEVFELEAFKVKTRTGLASVEYVHLDEEKFKGLEEAKMAVEVDRSAVGQGNLLLFLPQAAARNKFEVFVELMKAGYDVKGLELLELPCGSGELGCWYKLLPVTEELELDLPWLTPRPMSLAEELYSGHLDPDRFKWLQKQHRSYVRSLFTA